jgi:diadenosine tetraphosphate (Ap4A) HIT family hydrolase
MFIAKDITQFKNLFVKKLKDMLSDDELGAFILVLANSLQDDYLKTELSIALGENFIVLKNRYQSGELKATQDDLDVFKQLIDVDIQQLPVWQLREEGGKEHGWEVVCNVMRKLRPARASTQILDSIAQDFDVSKFHFNKPFLKPEILWQGEYQNKALRVLYNKFPFSDYHLLIVVSPEENLPQVLTQEMHIYACVLSDEVSKNFPGFGIGFNSLAAGASVNHLHFQGFVREKKFPIELIEGTDDYPLAIQQFSDVEKSWHYVQSLIEGDIAFNCLYRKDVCYVISRKYQGIVELPDWLAGAGWLDVAGVMTVSDKEMFEQIDQQSVNQALHLLSID